MPDNTIRPNLGTPDPKAIFMPMIMGMKAAADSRS
jgi:hypothetical protein